MQEIPYKKTRENDLFGRSAEIRSFLRTTPSNRATVSQFLHDVELELANYHAEINRLKTAIYAIETKRDRLKRAAERYKSLLSPIHTVPTEILTTIFTFACEQNELSRDVIPNVLRVSMVCGRWRDIVFSTPRLWASIEIDFGGWTTNFHVLKQLLQLFMERSKASSLRLSLALPGDGYSGGRAGREEVSSILRVIVGQCERWEDVTLDVVPQHFPSSIFDPIRGRLPLLTSLRIRHLDGSVQRWNHPFKYFEICPALHTLRIFPDLFDSQNQNSSLPWTQIQTLHLLTSYNVHAFPLLPLCTAVEHLELSAVGGPDKDNNDYSSHVVNSGVKTLSIMAAEAQSDVDGVLKHTTLGGLSSLGICSQSTDLTDEWPMWDSTCLEAFLQRSSCSITSLHLNALPITDMQILALLRLIPTITSLCIEEFCYRKENRIVTAPFLDGLNTSVDSVPLVPKLTHFKVRVHAHNLASDAFLKALSSRWLPDPRHAMEIGVECLRFVTIVAIVSSDQGQKDGHLDCLSCFKDAGMRFALTYWTFPELYHDEDYEDEEEDGQEEEEEEGEGDGNEDAAE
ncbi:hypothetical protein PQX77_015550 [Marasmius sp. AFHP31]|nr:hypothetical protein PQX77_015550 [Marasmius sp. AFHP31]